MRARPCPDTTGISRSDLLSVGFLVICAYWQEWEQVAKLITGVLVKGHVGFDQEGRADPGKWVDLRYPIGG